MTDSDSPPASFSRDFQLVVDPLDRGNLRFRTRTLAPSDHPLVPRVDEGIQMFVTLPHAIPATVGATYILLDILQSPLKFNMDTRELSYLHTGVDPLFDTPATYRYQVFLVDPDDTPHDALCVDVAYRDPPPGPTAQSYDGLLSTVRVSIRDDGVLGRDGVSVSRRSVEFGFFLPCHGV